MNNIYNILQLNQGTTTNPPDNINSYVSVKTGNVHSWFKLVEVASTPVVPSSTFLDTFSNSNFDLNSYNQNIAGLGSIVETTSLMINTTADSDAAAVIYKVPIERVNQTITVRAKGTVDSVSNYLKPLELWESLVPLEINGGVPLIGSSFPMNDLVNSAFIYWDQNTDIQVSYLTDPLVYNTVYDFILTITPTDWQYQIKSTDGLTTFGDSGVILWSNTRGPGLASVYLTIGDNSTSGITNMEVTSFKIETF